MTDKPKALHTGHRARLRKRFERAPHEAEEYEVLELLLGYALVRKDTKPLAKVLLQRFGTLRGCLSARPDELEGIEGFGPGLLSYWRLLRELLARYAEAPVREREVLASTAAIGHMARQRLTGVPHEECWLALVDSANRCIAWERLVRGGLDQAQVDIREVLEMALRRKASGVILVHNHPGGSEKASAPDLTITQRLKFLASNMGLRLLDHIIVTDKGYVSLCEQNLL